METKQGGERREGEETAPSYEKGGVSSAVEVSLEEQKSMLLVDMQQVSIVGSP